MALTLYPFNRIVQNIATAMQSSATAVLNFKPGSIFLALSQATAGVCLWLQAQIYAVLLLTRAATSSGTDLDSFYADFNFARLPASNATGLVTFSRFTSGQAAIIPFGAILQTADGSQRFTVSSDATNAAYTSGGYVLPAGTASVSLPVRANNAGAPGNVLAGSISVLSTPISFIDTVTNAVALTNGIDAESDPALRSRFFLYIASLSRGTAVAVDYAVRSVQQGLTDTITENQDTNGNPSIGTFFVVVDDGTGYPSGTLLTNVFNAIDAIRPLTIPFAIYPPQVLTAAASMSLTTAANYAHGSVVSAVGAALAAYINAIPLGQSLPYTKLAAVAYGVPGVTNVSGVLLNGGTADLVANKKQKILAGSLSIS